MSEIERVFNFEGHDVRTVMVDGEPWFVLLDVCVVLGIGNARMVADRLPVDCVSHADVVDGRGQVRPTNVVNETGLYRVILRSDKPAADPFMDWVTQKIKELRQTGMATVRPMSAAELLLAQAQQMVDAERRLAQTEQITGQHDSRLQALESNYGRHAALAYAKLNDLPDSVDYLNRLGRAAGKIGREQGVSVEKVHSTIFGTVNAWPDDVWDEAVRSLGSTE